jgi:formate-dependent nitrite reductase membrane component NrfD
MESEQRVDKSEYKNVVAKEKKVLMYQVLVMTFLSAIVSIIFLAILLARPVESFGTTTYTTTTNTTSTL